ncbi:hypothetical protein [Leptospira jelokensis]|uniref:hypothetical protein n=1 Tax=Leptospira jelokensis TaxID=2484931 RepID=UPI001FD3691E|nr:hypothetical protein [Leptospira jelokensis]
MKRVPVDNPKSQIGSQCDKTKDTKTEDETQKQGFPLDPGKESERLIYVGIVVRHEEKN